MDGDGDDDAVVCNLRREGGKYHVAHAHAEQERDGGPRREFIASILTYSII